VTTPAGPCFLCGAPYANHLNGQCPAPPLAHVRPDHNLRTVLILIAVAVLALYGFIHVASAEASKSSPPAACQLLGGSWNFWDGWTCN